MTEEQAKPNLASDSPVRFDAEEVEDLAFEAAELVENGILGDDIEDLAMQGIKGTAGRLVLWI